MLNETQEVHTSPTAPQKRSPLFLLSGLVIGLLLGLVYAWFINPVIYENTVPASLGATDKDVYRGTIDQVYAITGDLERAVLRLALLEDPEPVFELASQAQRALAAGNDTEARALALMASVLQGAPQAATPESVPLPDTPVEIMSPAVPTQTLPVPASPP